MTNALYAIGWNLLIAALSALSVWLLCRTRMLRQRPALCHGLWLLVLLKLVAPPLVSVAILPAFAPADLQETVMLPSSVEKMEDAADSSSLLNPGAHAEDVISRVDSSRASNRMTSQWVLIGLLGTSLCGTLVIWMIALRQLAQMSRLLKRGSAAVGREVELLRNVSLQFKRRFTLTLQVVDANVTPMLWAKPGNSTIILPRQLTDALDDQQLRGILAHELGHLVRWDYWSNVFAFAVVSVFWWNPVAWFARRELIAASEACCDALAVERLAGSRKSYAETLLAVVDFVATVKPLRPALCVTFGESHSVRRRFEVLANSSVTSNVSRPGQLLLALGCFAAVLSPAVVPEDSVSSALAAMASPADEPDTSKLESDSAGEKTNQDPKHVAKAKALLRFRGWLVLVPSRLSHARSRFAGEIVAIGKTKETAATANVPTVERELRFGDRVTKDQVLAVLWSRELGEKKVVLADELARLAISQKKLKRVKELLVKGATSERSVREAQEECDLAQISVNKVERTLRMWKVTDAQIRAIHHVDDEKSDHQGQLADWAKYEVLAPFDGTIVEKNALIGDIVGVGVDLFKVADLSTLQVMCQVPDADLEALKSLPPERRRLLVYPVSDPKAEAVEGSFDRIEDAIDLTNHTATMVGSVKSPAGKLWPGQFVDVTIDPPAETTQPKTK